MNIDILNKNIKTLLESHIKNIIDEENKNIEWEIIFGRDDPKNNSYFTHLDTSLFQKIYDKLKEHSQIIGKDDNEILDISFEDSSDISDFRISFIGQKDIIAFCKNQKNVLTKANILYKKKIEENPTIKINDYGIVSNQKIELDIIPSKEGVYTRDKLDLIYNKLGNSLENLLTIKKNFRYKNRLSFTTDNGFRFDLTILKTPPKKGFYTSFRESNVLKGNISYELEMEYLGYTNGVKVEFEINNDVDDDILRKLNDNKDNFLKDIHIKDKHLEIKKNESSLKLIYTLTYYERESFENIKQYQLLSMLKTNIINSIKDIIDYDNLEDGKINFYNDTDKIYKINKNLSDNLYYILSLQQNTPIDFPITTTSISDEIIGKYMELTKSVNKKKIETYTDILDNLYTNRNDQKLLENILYKYFSDLNEIFGTDHLENRNNNKPYLLFDENAKKFRKIKDYLEKTKEPNYIFKDYLEPKNNYFMNPKPITLELDNIKNNVYPTILNNYTVTDKADGVSNLLYIDNSGDIYLIDPNLRVIQTGLQCLKESNTILNGELITNNYLGKETYEFYVFDIYIRKNEDTTYLIFCHDKDKLDIKTRLNEMNLVVENINNGNIRCKIFYYGDNIFDLSKKCWNTQITDENDSIVGKNTYKYDGLIYTPMYLPIGYDFKNYFFNLFTSTTWRFNYKWKPENENSIDFLVEVVKNDSGSEKISRLNQMDLNRGPENSIKYKTLKLYNGKPTSIYKENPCQRLYDTKNKEDYMRIYNKSLFNPPSPSIKNIHLANIKINGKNSMLTEKNEVIEDNTIVEFYYDRNENNKSFAWKPLRVRNDKTIAYRKAIENKKKIFNDIRQCFMNNNRVSKICIEFTKKYPWTILDSKVKNAKISKEFLNLYSYLNLIIQYSKRSSNTRDLQLIKKNFRKFLPDYSYIPIEIQFGNNYTTANNVWKTIFNPITEEMITEGKNIDIAYEDSNNIYYNSNYNINTRHQSLTIYLQKFHNFIKKNILLSFYGDKLNKTYESIHLLDLACGKGGDLYKWKQLNYQTVVGFDIVYDNIYNKDNGACMRYNTLLTENGENTEKLLTKYFKDKKIPRVYFFTADSGENIKEQIEKGYENEKIIYKQLWENETNNHEDGYLPNFSMNKFHVVSLQFALHYFFESEIKLNNLINNINNNLRDNGIFIGTCYNGQFIIDDLIGKDFIEGFEDNQMIWKIKKEYEKDFNNFKNNNTDFNKKINIYMHSINAEHTEYLVNFDLLKSKLSDKKIIPLSDDDIDNTPLKQIYNKEFGYFKFEDLYSLDLKKNYTNLDDSLKKYLESIKQKMSVDEKRVSFFNVGFIYKKNIDIDSDSDTE